MDLITSTNDYLDGISCFGPLSIYAAGENAYKHQYIVLENKRVNLSELNIRDMDGGIDCVGGCFVYIKNSVVEGVGKAMLVGNEDLKFPGYVVLENCILQNNCRRCPEAQYGYGVYMFRCMVRNWGKGDRFDVRAFGAWAHSDGFIFAQNCVFWQDTFSNGHLWEDLKNHAGQAWNDRSLNPLDYITPGMCRGLTAGPGGKVVASNCWKNHPWIRIEGHKGPYMPTEDAYKLIAELEQLLHVEGT